MLYQPTFTKGFLFQIDFRQDLIGVSVDYMSHSKQLAVHSITQVIRNGPIAPLLTNKQYQKLVEFKKDKQDNQEWYKWLTIVRIF